MLVTAIAAAAGLASLQEIAGHRAVFLPDNSNIQYTGRLGFDDKQAPEFFYGASQFRTRFTSTSLALAIDEEGLGYGNSLGVRIDNSPEIRVNLKPGKNSLYQVAVGLSKGRHDLVVYRRTDALDGSFRLKGIILDPDGSLNAPPRKPGRRIEFFGDSVTAGALSEAVGFEAKSDQDIKVDGDNNTYTNAYWSYAAITARNLKAECHLEGIGGLALNDGNGWWCGDHLTGLLTTYDKLNPIYGKLTPWDFTLFTPQVVVIAVGQNDARFKDVHDPLVARQWKADFHQLLDNLRTHYPKATFILLTTILMHDLGWDELLKQIARETKSQKVMYFGYKRAGKGTPGHLRYAEHMEMAEELTAFINSLSDVWR